MNIEFTYMCTYPEIYFGAKTVACLIALTPYMLTVQQQVA